MPFNPPSVALLILVGIAVVLSTPVLFKGFCRRGKGVMYESNFAIQRAPQFSSLLTIAVIACSFFNYNGIFPKVPLLVPALSLTDTQPDSALLVMSWVGIALLVSGLVFMIGGWYSLGEFFTTDAEVLDGHTVRDTGLLRYVMHPAYSGIIQSLLGASIAMTSLVGIALTIFVVAPLWLNRAKYEEKILIEALGQDYKDYAERTKWRRLVPRFIPIGV